MIILLGAEQFEATAAGYHALLAWLRSFGTLILVGVEGTGAYAAGLACCLREQEGDAVPGYRNSVTARSRP